MKKWIIPYLLVLMLVCFIMSGVIYYKAIDLKSKTVDLAIYCFLFGMLGGLVNCLRAFYLHTSLLKDWDSKWEVWYFVRPLVSGIMGIVALIFLKAGLLIFSGEISVVGQERYFAYLAVAFLAGYNVQNFLLKIEEISKTSLGIKKKEPIVKEDNK